MSYTQSVQFSHSVMSNSLQPHGLQHARPPCPSPTPQSLPKPMSIESVMPSNNHLILCHPLLLLPSIFPASGSFQMSQLFASGGQSIGASASASVLPMNTQDWFPLGWTGWMSLQSKGLSRVFSNTTHSSEASILQRSAFFIVQLSHPFMTTGKTTFHLNSPGVFISAKCYWTKYESVHSQRVKPIYWHQLWWNIYCSIYYRLGS